ncbi:MULTISPECIES: GIY-YIG nuclease family protein [unclassified Cupriavidus]|uniref:GIY-YIG nuclease family protein n=1 Tax=unclassified Cupriavidus TaxID=2640874 RepID=UPI001AEB7A65|nr:MULTISPECIES: GIY-YIG nuclease family protein [unclassified Cupriavidus]MBP0633184.1 GIY-YIG nuclease family protein [Cupriavidus sp. AcVe19-1a]MBP0639645.1 GIY-YIG nuclease family protein [Cupriavidus sp. AcVe19-6a]
MNRLLGIGFQVAGHWLLDDGRLRIAIRQHGSQRNVLYAFVCDGVVKYVGKSTQMLRSRMAGYASPSQSARTNYRVRQLIHDMVAAGAAVEVFALPDNGLMHYGPFHLNLAAGLEDSIIRTLNPEWNMTASHRKRERGRDIGDSGKVDEKADEEEGDVEMAQPDIAEPEGTFEFKLQPTYRRTGFFNSGIASSPLLGADGDTVEIFFGEEPEPLLGTINRSANSNRSPRVFGGPALRQRFQTLPEMTSMDAEVLSPTSIRLKPSTEASDTIPSISTLG